MFFLLLAFAVPFLFQNTINDSHPKVAEATTDQYATLPQAVASTDYKSIVRNQTSTAANPSSDVLAQAGESSNSSSANENKSQVTSSGNYVDFKSSVQNNLTKQSVFLKGSDSMSELFSNNRTTTRNLASLAQGPDSNSKNEFTEELASLPKSRKKLKFLNDPFKSQVKSEGRAGALKLIEKSRVYESVKLVGFAPLETSNYRNNDQLAPLGINRYDNILSKMILRANSAPACPYFGHLSSGIYVYADYSLGAVNQMLSTTHPDYNNLLARRNGSESGALSLSVNVGLGKQWRSGLLLESGINYDRINTTFRAAEDVTRNTTMIITDTIYTTQGIDVVSDTVITTEISRPASNNSFRQINLPVLVGYDLPVFNRFSLVVKGGVLVNLKSYNSGTIEDQNGLKPFSSEDLESSIYKTNLSMAYVADLGLATSLTSDLSAYCGIRVNYYPNNFSLRNYPIAQTYTKYGLSAGLRYSL